MEILDRTDIMSYSQRNTSPKMEIERKYVYAFIDALMNSTSIQEVYETLRDEMHNGDAFILFNSFSNTARNLNKEPYRSIIAYSMLKKDMRLFELISASMFTGKVIEYHGSDLYSEITKETDENPLKYTDTGIYTDMTEGLIQIGFQNYYIDRIAEDGAGAEYQYVDELLNNLLDFDYIITLTKPARVEVLIFNVPYCYLSGTYTDIYSTGIDLDFEEFQCPFGDTLSMEILENLSDNEIAELYKEVSMYDTSLQADRPIECERSIVKGENSITLAYDMRCQSTEGTVELPDGSTTTKEYIWSRIEIKSNTADKTYVREKVFDLNKSHYEKYVPIMVRLKDNDPYGPCLALTIEHGTPTVGAMFYTRERV